MSSDSSLRPPISVRPSGVENGAARTIGSATLHLNLPQTIELIDELSRALAVKPLPAIPLHAQEWPPPCSHKSAHWRQEVNPTGFV
jgi:hypothetical protein